MTLDCVVITLDGDVTLVMIVTLDYVWTEM